MSEQKALELEIIFSYFLMTSEIHILQIMYFENNSYTDFMEFF